MLLQAAPPGSARSSLLANMAACALYSHSLQMPYCAPINRLSDSTNMPFCTMCLLLPTSFHISKRQCLHWVAMSDQRQVEVEAEVDGWLHCISNRGAKGLVPATYVRMLAPGEHAAPPSPPPRSHSRKISYDFFSQVRCCACLAA